MRSSSSAPSSSRAAGLLCLFKLTSFTRTSVEGIPVYQLMLEGIDLVDRPMTQTVVVGRVTTCIYLRYFKGAVHIDSLDAFPLKFHSAEAQLHEMITKRGQKWVELIGVHHMQYSGIAALKCGDKLLRHNASQGQGNGRPRWVWILFRGANANAPSLAATFHWLNANYTFPMPVPPKSEGDDTKMNVRNSPMVIVHDNYGEPHFPPLPPPEGITISKRRNRLKGDIVEALQFMKCAICNEILFPDMPSSATEPDIVEMFDPASADEEQEGLGLWDRMLGDEPEDEEEEDEGEDDDHIPQNFGKRMTDRKAVWQPLVDSTITACAYKPGLGPEPDPSPTRPANRVGLRIFVGPSPPKPDPTPGFQARPDPHITKNEVKNADLSPEALLLMPTVVYRFSLSDKIWFEFDVEKIEPVEWNKDALASLVLPMDRTALLQSLVEAHHEELSFDNFIKGKGHGLVINLFGPPGVGASSTLPLFCAAV
ncbi:hypothetical protein B0H10DRAFT_2244584 [Mycena sp. CBHHK59/15]|nr:hypothetical protein B0H10DRAFT_2244584 [Mycena sp. CBHHK59/15]